MRRTLVVFIFLSAVFFESASFVTAQVRQLAELTAPDGAAFELFGFAVAVDGTTIVVGEPHTFFSGPGKAYVYLKSGGTWKLAAELTDSSTDDGFGSAIAIAADAIIVGAPDASNGQFVQQGAVYVFVKPAGGWRNMTPTAQFLVPPTSLAQLFGDSVAISSDGTTVVAGAQGGGDAGSVYVFVKPAGGWQNTTEPTATLSAPSIAGLGNAVAMSGDTVVAGSLGGFMGLGACVFVKPPTGWRDAQPTATLSPSDGFIGDKYGASVAISGNTVAVGAPFQPSVGPGTVYVFVEPQGGWQDMTQTAELTLPVRSQTALGSALAMVGDLIAAGAPLDVIGNTRKGAVFGYLKAPGGWKNTNMPNLAVTSSDGANKDTFGTSVALSSTIGVIGAPQHAVNGQTFQGAAYVFGQR